MQDEIHDNDDLLSESSIEDNDDGELSDAFLKPVIKSSTKKLKDCCW